MFLIGAWDQVLSAGMTLRNAFMQYTGNAVSISVGFALFQSGVPVTEMAEKTAVLESLSKEHPGKNAISLFGTGEDNGHSYSYRFSWHELNEHVLSDKYAKLNELFANV